MLSKEHLYRLLEVVTQVRDAIPDAPALADALRSALVDDTDEPESGELENILKKVPAPEISGGTVFNSGMIAAPGLNEEMVQAVEDAATIAEHLAADHRVFVVDEAVRAGDVPPDELVYRRRN